MAENCAAVIKELLKAEKKLAEWKGSSLKQIDAVLESTTKLLEKFEEAQDVSAEDMASLQQNARKASEGCAQSHKKYHGEISKTGKAVDKHFFSDFTLACVPRPIEKDKRKLLDRCICEHLIRQSRVDINRQFCEEADMQEGGVSKEYVQINEIMGALRDHDVLPALELIRDFENSTAQQMPREHKEQINTIKFKLMSLHFISLVPGDLQVAIDYFQSFERALNTSSVQPGIRRLAGSFVYRQRLANSPYKDFVSPAVWDDVRNSFLRVATQLFGKSVDSPLSTCIYAGTKSFPHIVDMHQKNGEDQSAESRGGRRTGSQRADG
eukprot:scpid76935/ scgid26567/ Protein RMD5 homolog A &gt; Protein RMD5 homolog A